MTLMPIKDPDSVLDYKWDWRAKTNGTGCSDWLADSETISSYTITVPSGLTLDSDSESNGAVTAWLSGGTAGARYKVTCSIVTTAGRRDDRTAIIPVGQR